MELPLGIKNGSSCKGEVCKLKKSLYGLKQSPRAWFGRISTTMKEFGNKQSNSYHTLFIKHKEGKVTAVTPRIPVRPDWRIRTGFRDARLRTETLFFFFFKTELVHVGMAHILKHNPNIIYKSKNYHRSGVHQNLDTYN